jgi:dTDP-4-dehydrorhamnose reductase
MRWLVTGAAGMLGHDLCTVLAEQAETEVVAATHADLDITDPAAVHDAVAGADIVLNAAAWTNVDGAESSEAAATAVNGYAVRTLADAAGQRLVHFSTDYVFDGTATTPYSEDASPSPVNAYGRGKAIGEQAVLATGGCVLRTAWLYGEHGPNFVRTILQLAAERETIDVVDDQEGPPTWSYALAQLAVELARATAAGRTATSVYHGTAAGSTTWLGLGRVVFREAGLDPSRLRPTSSADFRRPARRPAYSVLGHDSWHSTGVTPLPDWHAMLSTALPTLLRHRSHGSSHA